MFRRHTFNDSTFFYKISSIYSVDFVCIHAIDFSFPSFVLV